MSITLDGNNANTVGVINSKTAQNATGTAVDFTGIPAGTKRITVMFNGVSTNGTDYIIAQLGSGGITTSGYNTTITTNGFYLAGGTASNLYSGFITICNVTENIYAASNGGSVTIPGILDRIRVTMIGTNTFDAGLINILYE